MSGTCKFFDSEKGFGFIAPSGGGANIFVHCSSITDGNLLQAGDTIHFDIEYDDRKGKYRAANTFGGSGGPLESAGER